MRSPKSLLATALATVLLASLGFEPAASEAIAPDAVKVVDGKIAASLTGAAGDALEGRKTFLNRKRGNCLACHANKDMSRQPFHGLRAVFRLSFDAAPATRRAGIRTC